MVGVTIFGIFFTPVFYNVIRWFAERGKPAPAAVKAVAGEPREAMLAGHTAEPRSDGHTGIQLKPDQKGS
jgi:hypothetical protein